MLSDNSTYATIPVTNLVRARKFYGETLGLTVDMDTEGGVMYSSGGTRFFVYPSRFKSSGHSQMSWLVPDIKSAVTGLRSKGIQFSEEDIPGVEMIDGIFHVGPKVWTAYFKDPDGNLLGLTEIG